jgi:hypothetical protein
MDMKIVAKRPEAEARVAPKPAGKPIIAEPQVESFVYRSREARIAEAAPKYEHELHRGVFYAYLGAWAALFAIFAIAFEDSAYTEFMILIGALNGVALFGVPIIMAKAGKMPTSGLAFGDFLRAKMATASGPLSGFEALVQVVLVPACLTLGALAIAYIMHTDYVNFMAELAERGGHY